MKYNRKGTELLRPEEAQTQKFGIKDPAMLIEILRDKLYSNKIRVICQEYLSNGRDAHREIDEQDVPLQVTLPSTAKSQIEFRDFGPGITPERMADVFCFFGESTKRDSNGQTGGFGIGAKSAWSYSEQFGVMTYVDGTLRHYSMAIDETRTGEMILLHTEKTTEANGTKIVVPVKSQDYRAFEEWVYRTTQWWDVRPLVTGKHGYHGWENHAAVVKRGTDWILEATNFGYHSESGEATAVVDGIAYPINSDNIESMDGECRNLLKHNLYLFFKTGELEVAANREQLDYVRKTQSLIRTRIKSILDTIKDELQRDLEAASNYWEAKKLWKRIVSGTNLRHIVKEAIWTAPDGKKIRIGADDQYIDYKIDVKFHRVAINPDGVVSRKEKDVRHVEIDDNQPLLINDSEKIPSLARLTSLYANGDANTIYQVFTLVRGGGESEEDYAERLQKIMDQYNMTYMPHTMMSTVERQKVVRAKGEKKKRDAIVYNVYQIPDDKCHDTYPKVNLDFEEAEGYYIPFEASYMMIGKDKIHVKKAYEDFEAAFNLLGLDPSKTNIYAIPVRFQNKVPADCKLKCLNKAINQKLDQMMKDSKVDLVDLAFMSEHKYNWADLFGFDELDLTDHTDKFDHDDNILLEFMRKVQSVLTMVDAIQPWIRVKKNAGGISYGKYRYESWGDQNKNCVPPLWLELIEASKEVKLYMPLISFTSYSSYKTGETERFRNAIIDYANTAQERINDMKNKMSLAV